MTEGTIGWAVKQMWDGQRMQRQGWNGMYIAMSLPSPDAKMTSPRDGLVVPQPDAKMTLPFIYMYTAQGDLVPWLCSQTDLLATDWQLWS